MRNRALIRCGIDTHKPRCEPNQCEGGSKPRNEGRHVRRCAAAASRQSSSVGASLRGMVRRHVEAWFQSTDRSLEWRLAARVLMVAAAMSAGLAAIWAVVLPIAWLIDSDWTVVWPVANAATAALFVWVSWRFICQTRAYAVEPVHGRRAAVVRRVLPGRVAVDGMRASSPAAGTWGRLRCRVGEWGIERRASRISPPGLQRTPVVRTANRLSPDPRPEQLRQLGRQAGGAASAPRPSGTPWRAARPR
jgi:hypothetical protein